jgi:hypothetical protein
MTFGEFFLRVKTIFSFFGTLLSEMKKVFRVTFVHRLVLSNSDFPFSLFDIQHNFVAFLDTQPRLYSEGTFLLDIS